MHEQLNSQTIKITRSNDYNMVTTMVIIFCYLERDYEKF